MRAATVAIGLLLTLVTRAPAAQFSLAGPDMKLMVLMQPEVQKELNLTGEQKKAINKAMKDMGAAVQTGGMGDIDKAPLAVLTPEQTTRLDELWIQHQGPCVLQKPEWADKIQLTDDQKTQVNALWSEYGKAAINLMMKSPGSNSGMKEAKKKRAAANEATLALLTEAQKTAYKALEGKEIKWRAKKEF